MVLTCSCLTKKPGEIHVCALKFEESMDYLPPLPEKANICQRLKRSLKKITLISERNPRSIEYFRSKAEIIRLKKLHVLSKSCIIHPFSMFRVYYEMYMSIMWLVILIFLPGHAAFNFHHNTNETGHVFILCLPIEIVCIVDIILNFLTGYTVKDKFKVIMKPMKIAKHYVFSFYFIPDVVSSLPFFFFMDNKITDLWVKILGFFKIVRLRTLFIYITRSAEILNINNATTQIVKDILLIYIVFHWFACLQFIVPHFRFLIYGNFAPLSWIVVSKAIDLPFLSQYILCFYRATACIFCVIYKIETIEKWEEKLLTIITHLFGKVFVFYITVIILHQLLSRRSLEVKYFETISQVKCFMSQKHLPRSMQARLLQFYDYKYNKKYFKEGSITSLLSDKLKSEINVSVCSKLVESVSLLDQLPRKNLEQVVTYLKPEIYLPNDIIIKAGSIGDCMYFLANGTVAVWTPSGKEICHLQDGAYFGEICLIFKDQKRTANIIAVEICEVYKLDRKAFKNCFKSNPELLLTLEEVATERLETTQMYEDIHTKMFMERNKTV